eukprot:TRINITY_DN73411_c0_g1_i1.p2 TRINITY_DN73411_c0_g1~~TRINITY_DN73411_c0_g1_i1.p2  ORF type:complete len:152 (+),score=59.99 TRINITY_DN73411_c0_g1_i1:41-457(+)
MLTTAGRVTMSQVRRFGCTRVLRELKPEGRLSPHEVEAAQAMRTVNRVTPGKTFMMNFIAGEQSIMSIANRVNSVFLVAAGAMVVSLLWGSALPASWVIPALSVYSAIFMYYHVGPKYTAPLALALLFIFFYKAHVEN